MMTQEQVEAQRQKYVTERQAFVEQANRQIALFDGAIAACDAILAGPVETPAKDVEEAEANG